MMSIGDFAKRSRLSAKALRLYDRIGILPPAHVDANSGYRFYDVGQLERARLISSLRQLGLPLADITGILELEPQADAERLSELWAAAEDEHITRRNLAHYLIDRLNGKESAMYEVFTRQMPVRTLLCLKRNVGEQEAWALGKEFIAILHDRALPRIEDREGAVFSIYWGEVSADSDGPVEWCRPIPADQAEELAGQCPELSPRTEAAHAEAFVRLGPGGQTTPAQWQLASESLRAWWEEQGIAEDALALRPEDLGMRLTYLASVPLTEGSAPDCDFAVPFGLRPGVEEPSW